MKKDLVIRIVLLLVLLAAMIVAIAAAIVASTKPGSGVRETYFEQFFTSGGSIVWFILLPMSVVMVYLAIEYSLTIRRKTLLPPGIASQISEIAARVGAEDLPAALGDKRDFVSTAVSKAIGSCGGDWFRLRNAVFESLQEQATGLFRKIEWVNLIGNVSPMVGLFGTIVGMIMLFNAMVIAGGQPQPVQLADGISVALVTTFWGLLIAIPALTVYGIFRNRIETLANEAVAEAEKVLPRLKVGVHRQAVTEQRPPIKEIPTRQSAATKQSSVPFSPKGG